jgi:hypothetical protein
MLKEVMANHGQKGAPPIWGVPPMPFEVQTSADPVSGTWTNHPGVTKSKTSISGLMSGSKTITRVRAINAAGTGAWSNEVGKIVP